MNQPRKPAVSVLDTNLFVSGTIIKRGIPFDVLEAWRGGRFILACSTEQRSEIADVITRPEIKIKYHLSEEEIARLLHLLDTTTLTVTLCNPLPLTVRDPKDAHILAAALGSDEVGYLVTGDTDLLVLRDDPRIGALQIVTAREFLNMLPGE